MTAPPSALCGHRWRLRLWCGQHADRDHRCQLDPDHTDPCPCPVGACTVHCAQPPMHRCGCGATTDTERN